MTDRSRVTVVRDPLWNNIHVDPHALAVVDAEPFQRLRYVRQLGHAYLVYPSAHHTRFEHAVGTYHLSRRALQLLGERGELHDVPADDVALIPLAGLLHDIGHYPFSHALEEAGLPSHEDGAPLHFAHPDLQSALGATGIPDVEQRLHALIRGRSDSPLQGLISGSLDLDKLEYLTRDARMCGVPYGTVDVDRLLHALTVVRDGRTPHRVGILEKGVAALESLLFARYQMYRNVYWHHAVRAATAMFKRAVRHALDTEQLTFEQIAGSRDEELMERLLGDRSVIARRLRARHLYKRAAEVPGEDVPDGAGDWMAEHPALTERVEDRVAEERGVSAGHVLLDFPAKARMLEVDMAMVRRDGRVDDLGAGGGELGILHVAEELHARARRLRAFSADPIRLSPGDLLSLADRTADEMETALEADRPLLDHT